MFLRKFGRRLGELLQGGDETHPPSRATQADVRPTEERPGPVDSHVLLENVRNALASDTALVAGRVNFVDLDRIRARFGSRWGGHIAARADDIARRSIERFLGRADMYTALSDMRYLITFADLSPEEAKLRCAMIGEEIARRLLGEEFGQDAPVVQTAVARVDGGLDFEQVPSVQAMAEALYEATQGAAESHAADTPFADPVPADEAGTGATGPAEERRREDPLHGVRFVYRPMWNVGGDVVSTYVYVPAVARPGGVRAVGEGFIFNLDDPRVVFDLDLMAMRQALLDLTRLRENGKKHLLAVPIHFESLATTSRRAEVFKLCKVIPKELQALLVFELVDVPVGIPQSRLLELTTMLKRVSRTVLLRLPLREPRFRPSGETGIGIVGTDLSSVRLPEKQIMRAFDRFCDGAQKAGLRTYVHGLRTLSLTTAALGAGFEYVDGDMVTSIVDEPGGLYRFDMWRMLSKTMQ